MHGGPQCHAVADESTSSVACITCCYNRPINGAQQVKAEKPAEPISPTMPFFLSPPVAVCPAALPVCVCLCSIIYLKRQ